MPVRFILCVWLLGSALQASAPPPVKYTYKKIHDPDGIGKFYLGREIAHVMGHQAASWLERKEREAEEASSKMLKLLALKPGMVVADIGAGSGYHSLPMAKMVGPKGKVLAVDIQKQMLAIIRAKMKKEKIKNIEPIRGTIKDPKLPPGKVDLILMVDVYHEFSYPHEMMTNMIKGLKPGGKIVFVEFRLEDGDVPIKLLHKMSKKQIAKEMAIHPVKHHKTFDSLPWQHVIIYEKTK